MPSRRLSVSFVVLALGLSSVGCKPAVPVNQVRPTGNGSTTAPSTNYGKLGDGNSTTTPPAGGASGGAVGGPTGSETNRPAAGGS
jgi:hypothetical protein